MNTVSMGTQPSRLSSYGSGCGSSKVDVDIVVIVGCLSAGSLPGLLFSLFYPLFLVASRLWRSCLPGAAIFRWFASYSDCDSTCELARSVGPALSIDFESWLTVGKTT